MTNRRAKRQALRKIEAASRSGDIIAMAAGVTIEAAESEDSTPKFAVNAYNGGAIRVNKYPLPVVVDLAGLEAASSITANLDHDQTQRVGHVTETTNDGSTLQLNGVLSGSGNAASEVAANASKGYPWQASIEAQPTTGLEKIPKGKTVTVNGQTHTGPILVARKTKLYGFAFLAHGADETTSATIAAEAAKGLDMDPKLRKYIEAAGFDADEITDEQVEFFKAQMAAQKPVKAEPKASDDVNVALEAAKVERDRVEGIKEAAIEAAKKNPHQIEAIQAMARDATDGESSTTVKDFKLQLLTNDLSGVPAIHSRRTPDLTDEIMAAAFCKQGMLKSVDKHFSEQTLEAADRRFQNGIGLKQLWLICGRANGATDDGSFQVSNEIHNAAFGIHQNGIQAAHFSTVSLPGILSNVANKFFREGWMSVEQAFRSITATRGVTDFKESKTYSLSGAYVYELLPPGGEINHGVPGEQEYGNKADTYARMLSIDRTDIVNDDLGALTTAPRRLGRGGALSMNKVGWTEFMDNATFFSAGNGNYQDGTATALDGTSLDAANTLLRKQTDPDGEPLGIEGAILLTPPELESTARKLMDSQKVVGDTDRPDGNIWAGRFTPVSSTYLSNTNYTGNSALAWYLLADPMVMPVIEMVFLNGREMPMVETAEATFNTLGAQMRGVHDFGVRKQEYRGGVKSKGEA